MQKVKLNVKNFPRPPSLEKTSRHLQIKWHGQVIADTREGYWVLETMHPPTYYLPPSSLKTTLTPTSRTSLCEWKGRATYYSITSPLPSSSPRLGLGQKPETVKDRIWSYDNPTPDFLPIKGYLSFYAGPWECFVDGEAVEPQPGDFYGGWITKEIEGPVKGGPGTWGW